MRNSIMLPRWDSLAGQFADGSANIRQAFEGLVTRYGKPAEDSSAIDAAKSGHNSSEDILGNPRPVGLAPEIGACEYSAAKGDGTAPAAPLALRIPL